MTFGDLDRAREDRRIMRRLLSDADAVCVDCHRQISPDEARIVIDGQFYRCGDCEYRRLHPEEER